MNFFYPAWKGFACAFVVFVISAIPGNVVAPIGLWNADKLIHSLMYFVLTILFAAGFQKQTRFRNLQINALMIAFYIAVLYGGIIEVLQENIFINRSGNIPDFAANTFGAIMAVYLYKYVVRNKRIRWFL